MASIKRWGLVTGGSVAGLLLGMMGALIGRLVLLPGLPGGVPNVRAPEPTVPLLLHVAVGFVLVWVYVGFRPRFGGGRRAVLGAVAAVWTVAAAAVVSLVALLGVMEPPRTALLVVALLVELLIAGFAGAEVYRRHAARQIHRRARSIDVMR